MIVYLIMHEYDSNPIAVCSTLDKAKEVVVREKNASKEIGCDYWIIKWEVDAGAIESYNEKGGKS